MRIIGELLFFLIILKLQGEEKLAYNFQIKISFLHIGISLAILSLSGNVPVFSAHLIYQQG